VVLYQHVQVFQLLLFVVEHCICLRETRLVFTTTATAYHTKINNITDMLAKHCFW